MSKKIFLIVALLIIIAVAITEIGIYSIDRLGDNLSAMTRLANRTINYNTLSSLQLRRKINLLLLLNSNTEEEMKGPAGRMEQLEVAF